MATVWRLCHGRRPVVDLDHGLEERLNRTLPHPLCQPHVRVDVHAIVHLLRPRCDLLGRGILGKPEHILLGIVWLRVGTTRVDMTERGCPSARQLARAHWCANPAWQPRHHGGVEEREEREREGGWGLVVGVGSQGTTNSTGMQLERQCRRLLGHALPTSLVG